MSAGSNNMKNQMFVGLIAIPSMKNVDIPFVVSARKSRQL